MSEAALWNILKGKRLAGLQFRRQYSIDRFILDFYCPALKLAIELDGDYHYHVNQPSRDYSRDEYLRNLYGITILRFENKTVFQQQYVIINAIMNIVNEKNNST